MVRPSRATLWLLILTVVTASVAVAGISEPETGIHVTLTLPQYDIEMDKDGKQVIRIEGFSLDGIPGTPIDLHGSPESPGAPPLRGNPAVLDHLELRILDVSDADDPFSPENQDGLFDTSVLTVVFAAGPLQSANVKPVSGLNPLDLLNSVRTNRHVSVRMQYRVLSPEGGTIVSFDRNVEFTLPLAIVELPVPGGGTAPFATISTRVVWDGRRANGGFVADGRKPFEVSADLFSFTGDLHGSGDVTIITPEGDMVLAVARPATGSVTVDNTPPAITASIDPEPNEFGWNNTDTTVSFEATDLLAGVESVSPPTTLTAEGMGHIVTGTARDRVANVSSLDVVVDIDKTAPVFSDLAPAECPQFGTDLRPAVRACYDDLLSGVDVGTLTLTVDGLDRTAESSVAGSCIEWQPAGDLTGGTHEAGITAHDRAGNIATQQWCFEIKDEITAAVERFAPVLMFDRNFRNLPMSAEEFFDGWLCCDAGCPPRDAAGKVDYLACPRGPTTTHRYDPSRTDWDLLSPYGPFALLHGWYAPRYLLTLQTADIDDDGREELLGRGASGMEVYEFNGTLWLPMGSAGPFPDQQGWYEPQYYATIQTANLDGVGPDELLGRGAAGIVVYRFANGHWTPVAANGPLTDQHGWTEPQYYLTIQTADLDGDGREELLARGAFGMAVFRFVNSQWTSAALTGPLTDAQGWNQAQYYSTIQTADLDGDGREELLARGAFGMAVFRFANGSWTPVTLVGPFTDEQGWDQQQYYSTIQTADIDGDGRDELLGRGASGMAVYRFAFGQWVPIAPTGPFRDATGWDTPYYYMSIMAADVDGDGEEEILGRAQLGLLVHDFDTASNAWELAADGGPFAVTSAVPSGTLARILAADIDGDGRKELISHELPRYQNYDPRTLHDGAVPTYYQAKRCAATGQLRIRYWWFYGFQPPCNNWPVGEDGAHFGDWEGITVTTNFDMSRIQTVTYDQHSGYYTRQLGYFSMMAAPTDPDPAAPKRPVVYVGQTGHGSYHDLSLAGWGLGTPLYCCTFSDLRMPAGPENIWFTNKNLVNLADESETWMEVEQDDQIDWRWGPDYFDCHFEIFGPCDFGEWVTAVWTHPTTRAIDWQMPSCQSTGCVVGPSYCYPGLSLSFDQPPLAVCPTPPPSVEPGLSQPRFASGKESIAATPVPAPESHEKECSPRSRDRSRTDPKRPSTP